jgi:hypothetical protein
MHRCHGAPSATESTRSWMNAEATSPVTEPRAHQHTRLQAPAADAWPARREARLNKGRPWHPRFPPPPLTALREAHARGSQSPSPCPGTPLPPLGPHLLLPSPAKQKLAAPTSDHAATRFYSPSAQPETTRMTGLPPPGDKQQMCSEHTNHCEQGWGNFLGQRMPTPKDATTRAPTEKQLAPEPPADGSPPTAHAH